MAHRMTGIVWPLEKATFSNQGQVEIASRIAEFVGAPVDTYDEDTVRAAEADAQALRQTLKSHPCSRAEQLCVLNYAEAAEDRAGIWRIKVSKERARAESAREGAMSRYLEALDKLADAVEHLGAAAQPELPANMRWRYAYPGLAPMDDISLGRERERTSRIIADLQKYLAQFERYGRAVASVKGAAAKVAAATLDAITTEYRAKLADANAALTRIDEERTRRHEQAERERAAAEFARDSAAAIMDMRQRLDSMDATDAGLQAQLDALQESLTDAK